MELVHDVRIALRSLRKEPTFALVAVACLAIGIGATTTIFSLANGLFLRPLPGLAEPSRLVDLQGFGSYPALRDLRRAGGPGQPVEAVGGFLDRQVSLESAPGEVRSVLAQLASGDLFPVLGTAPALGRLLAPGDERERAPVVVLGHALWRERFGGDPSAVGRSVRINGVPFTVVGVAPEGFIGTFVGIRFDLWLPITAMRSIAPDFDLEERAVDRLEVVARLAPGATAEQARGWAAAQGRELAAAHPGTVEVAAIAVEDLDGFDPETLGPALGLVALLLAVALLVQLTACLNVANLLLARATARRREVGMRLALGAARGHVARLVLVESLLLAGAGGATGILVAAWATDLLHRLEPPVPFELAFDFSLDARVVAFAFVAAAASGLLAGLAPALRVGRRGRGSALAVPRDTPRASRLRSALVVSQVVASMVLLVVAGLLLRTLGAAARVDPGFEPDGVAIAPLLDLRLTAASAAAPVGVFDRLEEQVAALPGVSAAGLAGRIPLVLGGSPLAMTIPGHQPPPGHDAFEVDADVVSPGLFTVLGIPLRRGRGFTAADRAGAPEVAVVNEAFARRFWPRDEPLGRRLVLAGTDVQVVGVVGDVPYDDLGEAPLPFVYRPLAQQPAPRMNLLVRTAARVEVAGEVRRIVHRLAPALPAPEVVPLREFLGIALLVQRVAGTVAAVLGLVTLGLAGLGLYGLMAFVVSQRVRELGVRIALGANRPDLQRLVIGRALRLTLWGAALGTVLALPAAAGLSSLLFGVAPLDPATYAAVAALLVGTALLGSVLPARRAGRVDPIEVLRAG